MISHSKFTDVKKRILKNANTLQILTSYAKSMTKPQDEYKFEVKVKT